MKKTISFVLVAFLILLGVAKTDVASAQLRLVPMSYVETYSATKLTPIPIICDGVVIDHLSGSLDVFCRMFGYYDPAYPGNNNYFHWLWMIHTYTGFLTGEFGEVFEIRGVKKLDGIDKDFTFHLNIKGSSGSHYILFASGTNSPNYTFTVDRAVCLSSCRH
jgi:hypothetical protein